MIWQFMTKKKCQRQLKLVELLYQERFSVTELAEKICVSSKTIMRDLYELQQQKYVKKEKFWQINWRSESSYSWLYRKILMADPSFQLFQQYLWHQGPQDITYSKLKKLNQHLIWLNLSADRSTGRLLGAPALVFHLQLRYLRDFYQLNEPEIYQQLDRHYQNNIFFCQNSELFPEPAILADFAERFELDNTCATFFFLDYVRHHYQLSSDYYFSHQEHQTELYRETAQGRLIVEQRIGWETELFEKIFTIKLFELFLEIHQGIPLAVFNLQWKESSIDQKFLVISKEFKREIPSLSNCRLDELAAALKNILFSSHQIALTLNPNLKSSLVIQERQQAIFRELK